jgi:hypothetical protein
VRNSNTQPVTNGYSYSDYHFYAYSYSNGCWYSHTYLNTNCDSAGYPHAKVHSAVAVSAHSAASPVSATGESIRWNALSLEAPQPCKGGSTRWLNKLLPCRLIFAPSTFAKVQLEVADTSGIGSPRRSDPPIRNFWAAKISKNVFTSSVCP